MQVFLSCCVSLYSISVLEEFSGIRVSPKISQCAAVQQVVFISFFFADIVVHALCVISGQPVYMLAEGGLFCVRPEDCALRVILKECFPNLLIACRIAVTLNLRYLQLISMVKIMKISNALTSE